MKLRFSHVFFLMGLMVILGFAKFINAQFDFLEDEFGTCKNQIDNSMIKNVVTRLNFVV